MVAVANPAGIWIGLGIIADLVTIFNAVPGRGKPILGARVVEDVKVVGRAYETASYYQKKGHYSFIGAQHKATFNGPWVRPIAWYYESSNWDEVKKEWGPAGPQTQSDSGHDHKYKNMNWRGTYAMYSNDAAGSGPYTIRDFGWYRPAPQVLENLENLDEAVSSMYSIDLAVQSRVYTNSENMLGKLYTALSSGSFPGRNTYTAYVKISYRRLGRPQTDGMPGYIMPNVILHRLVKVYPSTTAVEDIVDVPNGLELGEEYVDGVANGEYLRWWQDDGHTEYLYPVTYWVPKWVVKEQELPEKEAF